MTSLKELKRKLLRNPEVKAEYEALKLEDRLAAKLTRIRVSADLTQAELAKKIGAKQAAVARFESGRHLPGLDTLESYALATGCKLIVDFVPAEKAKRTRRVATSR